MVEMVMTFKFDVGDKVYCGKKRYMPNGLSFDKQEDFDAFHVAEILKTDFKKGDFYYLCKFPNEEVIWTDERELTLSMKVGGEQ